MNSKNYLAYRKNIEKEKKQSISFDNLVVGEVVNVKKNNSLSIDYIKEEPKFIFQKLENDGDTKYIEVFSGMLFSKFNNSMGPFVVNEEPLLNYIDLNTDISMINLVEVSDRINSKQKEFVR